MDITKGTIVKSVAGHDKGEFYCVAEYENSFALLINGKTKRISNPKRKSLKHFEVLECRVDETELKSDKKIRRLLREIAEKSV